jgi:hypothetical protein
VLSCVARTFLGRKCAYFATGLPLVLCVNVV